nr:hypothetical protein [uncultured Deefgea sp.]
MKPTQQPLALLLLLATAGSAIAQTPVNCRSIVSSTERLACYDQANGGAPEGTSSTASSSTKTEAAAVVATAPETNTIAATPSQPASSQSTSMIAATWGLDPSSDRYQLNPINLSLQTVAL